MPTFHLTLSALTLPLVLEWTAAYLTVGGAWLLATTGKRAAYGWLLFLGANCLWIAFALQTGLWGLLAQQLVLTCISLKGIKTGLLDPWIDRMADDILENVTHGKKGTK